MAVQIHQEPAMSNSLPPAARLAPMVLALALAATTAGCATGTDAVPATPADPATAPAAPPRAAAAPALIGTTWAWQRTIMSDDKRFEPRAPARYTVTFGADGRMAVQADCNRGAGGYELDEPQRRIRTGPMALTRAMCPEGSLDTAFAQQLSRIQGWLFQGPDLVLTLDYDSGSMFFRGVTK
jgi:heat shock protein HslJ